MTTDLTFDAVLPPMSEMENINHMMARALKMERFGQCFFSLFHELVEDEDSKILFQHLATENARNCDAFIEEMMINEGEIAEKRIFNPEMMFNKGARVIKDEGLTSIMGYAIEIERRLMKFYRMALTDIKNSGIRKLLKELANAKERNKHAIEECLVLKQMEMALS